MQTNTHTLTHAPTYFWPRITIEICSIFFSSYSYFLAQPNENMTHTYFKSSQSRHNTCFVEKGAKKRKCCNRTSVVLRLGWECLKCLFGIRLASVLGLIEHTHTHPHLDLSRTPATADISIWIACCWPPGLDVHIIILNSMVNSTVDFL